MYKDAVIEKIFIEATISALHVNEYQLKQWPLKNIVASQDRNIIS